MNHSVLQLFKCPVCHAGMTSTDDGKVCRCMGPKTHCFDFAKSGYLNLGGAHAGDGDLKSAVQARRMFLDAGYYQILSDKLNELLDLIPSQTVLDAGCGEGYYTNRMAKERAVLGIDLSRAGIDLAAKRAKQTESGAGFAVASIFDLPVQNGSADVVTNLFAPCAEQEFLRVLRPGGYLILVGAGERHLMGLKEKIYENAYENVGRADLPKQAVLAQTIKISTKICVKGHEMISALFSMTPYYWRTSQNDKQKLDMLEHLTTEIDFDIFLYRKGL